MKTITNIIGTIALLALLSVIPAKLLIYGNTNEPPAPLAPPTNLLSRANSNQVVKLQSTQPPKTNAPVFHVEQSGNSGTFDEASALFGAWAMSRNPDVRDAKTIVDIARGLWQAQKRADALRQTNSPAK